MLKYLLFDGRGVSFHAYHELWKPGLQDFNEWRAVNTDTAFQKKQHNTTIIHIILLDHTVWLVLQS